MKSFVTMSDAGSVAIGTKDAWFLVPNGYGDGETSVLVFDEYQEWNDFSKQHPGWRFFTSLEGKRLEIVGYDCPSLRPWFDGSVHGWNPIVTLSGRYSAYYSNGEVALVRTGDTTQL